MDGNDFKDHNQCLGSHWLHAYCFVSQRFKQATSNIIELPPSIQNAEISKRNDFIPVVHLSLLNPLRKWQIPSSNGLLTEETLIVGSVARSPAEREIKAVVRRQ